MPESAYTPNLRLALIRDGMARVTVKAFGATIDPIGFRNLDRSAEPLQRSCLHDPRPRDNLACYGGYHAATRARRPTQHRSAAVLDPHQRKPDSRRREDAGRELQFQTSPRKPELRRA